MRRIPIALSLLCAAVALAPPVAAQVDDMLFDAITHPAIAYVTTPLQDPVARLTARLRAGSAHLDYDRSGGGYLRSVLAGLGVPIESQMAVFSKTSLQSSVIASGNPRSIFFTDDVAVAWPRGGFIEIAAHDPQQGVQFYMLEQREIDKPEFLRPESFRPGGACLACHQAFATLGVPGMLARSVAAGRDGRLLPQLANYITDDRSPLEERWAGWYVTGRTGTVRHLGNPDTVTARDGALLLNAHATAVESLAGTLDLTGYLTPYSDVAALLVFDHQTRLVNLLTRVGWAVRIATADKLDAEKVARETAAELADAMLFVDEAPLPGRIESTSGFVRAFESRGPADAKGRSLRQLDLTRRLMRYPCSYMIYSAAFSNLPPAARDAVYARMWRILSGAESGPRYARLSAADRRAIVEILRDTKPDLPAYFALP